MPGRNKLEKHLDTGPDIEEHLSGSLHPWIKHSKKQVLENTQESIGSLPLGRHGKTVRSLMKVGFVFYSIGN